MNENLLEPTDGKQDLLDLNNNQNIIDSINESNAEKRESYSEESTTLSTTDLESLSLKELCDCFKNLLTSEDISSIKEEVQNIRKVFISKYQDLLQEKKQQFFKENPDAQDSDFYFESADKKTFDELSHQYRTEKNKHQQSIQEELKRNLEKRKAIISELKNIVENTSNFNNALKDIQSLRDRWNAIGAIPKDNYNILWNDYHFHIERFYDQLQLDRETRDLDFKHNLSQKQNLIQRAKELLNETDRYKAFREIQLLHRIWKEETGPVAKEFRESIWDEFSNLTKQIHENLLKLKIEIKQKEEANFEQKVAVIDALKNLTSSNFESHNQWQEAIKKVENLHEQFNSIGRVPTEKNEKLWEDFKNAFRSFNRSKNNFYKNIKNNQLENLKQKKALLEKAIELKDSNDFQNTTPLMVQIQEKWKHIGHIPKKQSDQLWKEFKSACNYYFDRLNEVRNKEMEVEMKHFEDKKAYYEIVKATELTGEHKTDLEKIKKHIEHWKTLGKVPQNRRHIEGKFNKALDNLFEQLSTSKKEAELMKFQNKLEQLIENKDQGAINKEIIFVQRKIEEIQNDIFQLENNIQFIQGAKSDNPLIKEINKNIERHKDELRLWKEKWNTLKSI